MKGFLMSFYQYLVKERLGYRRPSRPVLPVMPDSDLLRSVESERLERLERNVQFLDANIDLIRVAKSTRRQPS